MAEGIFRIDRDDDPNRCQGVTAQGQCVNKAAKTENGDYGKYCLVHGGNRFLESKEKESLKNYRIDRFKARLGQFSASPGIKNLRDEIAILRLLMEERVNRCADASDLILQSGPISDLVLKIEKVITSCHKLEGSMGQLLDKSALLQFASEILDIIGSENIQPEILERIGNKIIGRIQNESV